MDITKSEKQDIYQALNIWADYIETGSGKWIRW